jgi:hypothetical protein
MYIRWIVRKHKNASTANVVFHDAYLVESFRDLRETPRQRQICYLGNIRQINDEFPAIERELFLLRAERILASTPEIKPDEYEAILDMLRQKVPALTEAEVAIAFHNNLRWYHQWWRERGCTPTREELLALIDSAAEGIGPV